MRAGRHVVSAPPAVPGRIEGLADFDAAGKDVEGGVDPVVDNGDFDWRYQPVLLNVAEELGEGLHGFHPFGVAVWVVLLVCCDFRIESDCAKGTYAKAFSPLPPVKAASGLGMLRVHEMDSSGIRLLSLISN